MLFILLQIYSFYAILDTHLGISKWLPVIDVSKVSDPGELSFFDSLVPELSAKVADK